MSCKLCGMEGVNASTCPSHIKNRLNVQDPWLKMIGIDEKTVEGRVGPEHKFDEWIGKPAIFFMDEKEVPVAICSVRHYDTLDAYLEAEGWKNAAPHLSSLEETKKAYAAIELPTHEKVFSEERIKRLGGINALHIHPIFDSFLT